MKIHQIISPLEAIAPPSYQENYDNAGLICGDPQAEASGAVLCLDATEAVVEEAVRLGCNLVVAHHPIIFKGLKRLTGANYVERTVISAIRQGVAIYAIHTNLDNVYHRGVNSKIAERLGLTNARILAPRRELKKLSAFVAAEKVESLRSALFEAGAGDASAGTGLSFTSLGVGTTGGASGAQMKLEVVFPSGRQGAVVAAMRAAVQGIHYEVISLENSSHDIGAGMVGELPKAMKEQDFLKLLKQKLNAPCIRHTRLLERPVQTVAVCGGAGGFLLPNALAQKADAFVTADYKYHEFFDADGRILIADIGHYESEQFTGELLRDIIAEKFPTFALHLTEVLTNPVFVTT